LGVALRCIWSSRDPASGCGARENEQTRSGRTLPFGRKPERNSIVRWISVSATLNVRGLSFPDQTRVVARRHLDRLLVSLHRAVVSRLSRT
jgi:hypothetical protein